jgi:hypothetical protein
MTFSWYPLFATVFTAPMVDLVEEARTVGRAANRESPRRATVEVDREVEAVAVVMAVLNIICVKAIVLGCFSGCVKRFDRNGWSWVKCWSRLLYLRKSPLFIVTGNGTDEIDLRSLCGPRMGQPRRSKGEMMSNRDPLIRSNGHQLVSHSDDHPMSVDASLLTRRHWSRFTLLLVVRGLWRSTHGRPVLGR